ncbi:MAG: CmcI family methyltransferase [Solirubrobacteraceae bacterium]
MDEQELVDRFHVLWYESQAHDTWRSTSWFGAELQQCPLDLWIYQELICRVRPEVFVEIGVKRGGLTRFVSDLLRLLHGRRGWRVIGVDITLQRAERAGRMGRRVRLLEGDSVDRGIFERVARECRGKRTMVLLDSDHSAAHVRRELELYATLVTPGSYIIVNDTNINGHPALAGNKGRGPGPFEAVQEFLAEHPEFEADPRCERYLLTMNPSGYLRHRE